MSGIPVILENSNAIQDAPGLSTNHYLCEKHCQKVQFQVKFYGVWMTQKVILLLLCDQQ